MPFIGLFLSRGRCGEYFSGDGPIGRERGAGGGEGARRDGDEAQQLLVATDALRGRFERLVLDHPLKDFKLN